MIQFPLSNFAKDPSFPFCIQYGSHEQTLYRHSHVDFSELVIVLDGKATHIVEEEHYHISKGDVFVISNDTTHAYENAVNFHICNIMFSPSFLTAAAPELSQTAGFQALFVLEPECSHSYRFCSRLKLDSAQFSKVYSDVFMLYQEYTEEQIGWHTAVQAEFLKLVVMLSRMYDVEHITQEDSLLRLAPALAYIEQHYDQPCSLSELAELTYYSERHFIRLFQELYSCNPTTYVKKLRMQKAQELLATTQLPITEIAARCGYPDSNYFSRIFKQQNNMTPKQYRIHHKDWNWKRLHTTLLP
ncbi:MAG: helix-turn-helix domain-containing protein [Oscillospiraceae bacterium]|nr:helix-turn-helix domain-containing protein [Oscillospiraceae bacterium]